VVITSKIFGDYIKQIPEDFEFVLKGLGNKFRLSLTLLLSERKFLSLTELVKITNLENSVLLNHIKKLQLAGIIQNFLKKEKSSREFSFYEITDFGNKVLSDLIEIYNNFLKIVNRNHHLIEISYTQDIPKDLELALKSISNSFRFAITLYLIENGPISFSELTEITKKENSLIASHIKRLELGGIVQNFLEKKNSSSQYSFYKITSFGKSIISGLLNSYNDYYNVINDSELKELDKKEEHYFDADYNKWALPNEKI